MLNGVALALIKAHIRNGELANIYSRPELQKVFGEI